MSAGEFFVAAVVVGMVLAIIAFSIRKGTQHAGMRHDRSGGSDIDPGISYLMTPGAMGDGSSHSSHHGHADHGHHGHHGHDAGHAHDHGSHGSFDSCSPVDSGGGCDGGGGGDGGGGCGGGDS